MSRSFSIIRSLHFHIVSMVNDKTCLRTLSLRENVWSQWESPVSSNIHHKVIFARKKSKHFRKYFSLLTNKMSPASSFIITLIVRIVAKVASQYVHKLWIKLMKNACRCKEYKKCLKWSILHDMADFWCCWLGVWSYLSWNGMYFINNNCVFNIIVSLIIFRTENNFKNV